jgi:nitroimidazol reductase NimA-like FMN-containing flavoprotein (pyridoxamine 5'-phosphate oxidase superfamily)
MTETGRATGLSVANKAPAPPRGEGLEILSREECIRLLGRASLGRVGASVGALPAVLPVSFALVGGDVVFPVEPGGELDMAARDAVVAFEADCLDPMEGWSVVVTGIAAEVPEGEQLALLRALAGAPWPPGERQCFFRIPAEMVSGRRLLNWPLHVSGSVPVRLAATKPDSGSVANGIGVGFDGARLEPIPADECLRLLATEEVGRLVVVLAGQPRVFPVNYALDGDAVVFRTASGTKLEAISRSLVAFEVDRFTASTRTGWSVVVEGFAQEVTSVDAPGLRERMAALPVRPWAPGDRLHYVRIVPVTITGVHLHPPAAAIG